MTLGLLAIDPLKIASIFSHIDHMIGMKALETYFYENKYSHKA